MFALKKLRKSGVVRGSAHRAGVSPQVVVQAVTVRKTPDGEQGPCEMCAWSEWVRFSSVGNAAYTRLDHKARQFAEQQREERP